MILTSTQQQNAQPIAWKPVPENFTANTVLYNMQPGIVYERFNFTNVAACLKRLQNAKPTDVCVVNLCDYPHPEKIVDVYAEIVKLKNIAFFICEVSQLRENITQLTSLEGLALSGKKTETLPDYLSALTQLKRLNASELKLNVVPECVFKMLQLQSLQLNVQTCGKQLTQLFDSVVQLEKLEIICAAVTSLPENLGNLKNLKSLSFAKSKLKALPRCFSDLKKLERLEFQLDTKTHFDSNNFFLPAQLLDLTLQGNDGDLSVSTFDGLKSIKSLCTETYPSEILCKAFSKFVNLESLILGTTLKSEASNTILKALSDNKNFKHLDCPEIEKMQDIGLLKNLETLKISIYHKTVNQIVEFGKEIESQTVQSTIDCIIPNSWNNLQNLVQLDIRRGKCDLKYLEALSSLKMISIAETPENYELFLESNTQLESIKCFGILTDFEGVERFKNLRILVTYIVDIQKSVNRNFSDIEKLETLSLIFSDDIHPEFLPQFFKELSNIKSLRTLTIDRFDHELPVEFGLLQQLKTTHFIYKDRKPLIEIALLPNVTLESPPNYEIDIDLELREKFYGLKNYDLTDAQRLIVWGLITDNFVRLREYVPNSAHETLKTGSIIYLSGRMHGITQPKLKELLKAKNISVSTSLTDAVTHISVGEGLKIEEAVNIVTSKATLMLSEYLTDFLTHPDDFYLLQEGNNDLTKQIIKLFLSEDEANHQLALQMLEGGGATKRVLNYLMVFAGVHPNSEIRKEARNLFKRFASKSLVEHTKNNALWSYLESNGVSHLARILNHPELNYWDGFLAYQQFRDKIAKERLASTTKYSVDIPHTLFIANADLNSLSDIPEELAYVNISGILFNSEYQTFGDLELLREKIAEKPQLKKHFYCMFTTVTKAQYATLQEIFETVHLNRYFTVVE